MTHDWQRVHSERRTYFADEPNSRRKHRPVDWVICLACMGRGFRYRGSQVVYVCDRDAANWIETL